MPTITIDGKACEFEPGQTILQVALANGINIPYYCYHPGLSVVASCRICLAEVWAPNPRNDNKLEPIPKLAPTCQTTCGDGQVVYTDSPKAIANQKSVMEYLLINHPLDCPVCDQAGECLLQDYSYQYGRSVSRFEEDKIKQPKKDLGPNVLLYADRCIMCSRCVRFTREVTETAELTIEGRGAHEQIDVFPGKPLDNELASNVIDLCPVGALLDKDFLFAQRVWYLKEAPSIDGVTASGDNIWIEHNDGKVYRVKPRENLKINRWWITDEVRYTIEHIHSPDRLRTCVRRQFGAPVEATYERALREAHEALTAAKGVALVVSPMLASEEAYALGAAVLAIDADATLAVGPVPTRGEDRVYPPNATPAHAGGEGFVVRAEKAPNARGVRAALEALAPGRVRSWEDVEGRIGGFGALVLTGNYPTQWAPESLLRATERGRAEAGAGRPFLVLLDTLRGPLAERADVVIPGATWVEKNGSFVNAEGVAQAFERAIIPLDGATPEGQIALDLRTLSRGERIGVEAYEGGALRREMASEHDSLRSMGELRAPAKAKDTKGDMAVVEL